MAIQSTILYKGSWIASPRIRGGRNDELVKPMLKNKPPTQRQLRVGEEIRHILAKTLSYSHSGNELLDQSSITVTEVRVSPDLQNATVFVLPLGGQKVPEILNAFKERAWYFRREVAHQLQTRIAPRLVFQADLTFDEAQRIETLLKSPKVKKDIEKIE